MTAQTKTLKELLLTYPPSYDAAYDTAKMGRANYVGLLLNQKIAEKEKENPDKKLLKAIEEESDNCREEMPDTVEGLIDMLDKYSKLVKEFKGINA